MKIWTKEKNKFVSTWEIFDYKTDYKEESSTREAIEEIIFSDDENTVQSYYNSD